MPDGMTITKPAPDETDEQPRHLFDCYAWHCGKIVDRCMRVRADSHTEATRALSKPGRRRVA